MTEPVAAPDSTILSDDFDQDYELPTNHLSSRALRAEQADAYDDLSTTDWLASLSAAMPPTKALDEDEPPAQPGPSGMGQHATPPRMAPTVGAKLTTGLRKGLLLLIVSALTLGALGGAGYLLVSTPWVSSLFTAQAGAGATGAAQTPAQPRPRQSPGEDIQSPTDAQGPATQGGPGQVSAQDLRDKGLEQYRLGNFDQAITLLESSVNQADDPIAYYQLGLAYMAVQGRERSLDDAEMAFRTAISLQPDWAAPEQGLAESLMRRGFYKDAIDPALKATQLDPSMEQAWITLGRAYQGNGQDAEATKAFAQASKLAPAPPVQP